MPSTADQWRCTRYVLMTHFTVELPQVFIHRLILFIWSLIYLIDVSFGWLVLDLGIPSLSWLPWNGYSFCTFSKLDNNGLPSRALFRIWRVEFFLQEYWFKSFLQIFNPPNVIFFSNLISLVLFIIGLIVHYIMVNFIKRFINYIMSFQLHSVLQLNIHIHLKF